MTHATILTITSWCYKILQWGATYPLTSLFTARFGVPNAEFALSAPAVDHSSLLKAKEMLSMKYQE